MSRHLLPRTLAAFGIGVGLPALAVGCGAPTHQLIRAGDTSFTYEVPAEFTELGGDGDEQSAAVYGLPDTPTDTLANDPVLLAVAADNGDVQSFQTLRVLGTGGKFDPLDPELNGELPNDTLLLDYIEIGEPDVWGIRMRLAIGQGVTDFQALIDRRSDQLVLTEVFCTQACFLDQLDLIDDIQTSWSLES